MVTDAQDGQKKYVAKSRTRSSLLPAPRAA